MIRFLIVPFFAFFALSGIAREIHVGANEAYTQIKPALSAAIPGDTVMVGPGHYSEGNIVIDKRICFLGKGMPVLDGERKFEILSIKADSVTVGGFRIQRSGFATMDEPGAIKIYDGQNVTITGNILYDNFFGIYVQYGRNCVVKNNVIVSFGREEQQIGNGIHCWKSDSLQITGNRITGHRDGIYFEFVTHSVIWRNVSFDNIRYGLHFMFSNDDSYISNVFRSNGAGVAVMFTNRVKMFNNTFENNWGDASYGLLLKEISDAYVFNNRFANNTTGIFMEGTNRNILEKNVFSENGWGMKMQASCMDNEISSCNFLGNTFDVATNGSLILNTFSNNYWDNNQGYDLNKDGVSDVAYRPLSLFSVIAEKNPPAMLLYRSFMVTLLDRSEKILPSLTPANFIDEEPLMSPVSL